jgi:hypothetical protein
VLGRRSDRWRKADVSTEAIVSSDNRGLINGAVPAVHGALLDYACTGHARPMTALRCDRATPSTMSARSSSWQRDGEAPAARLIAVSPRRSRHSMCRAPQSDRGGRTA